MKAKQNNGVHRVHEGYQKKEQLWNMGNDQWQPHKTKKCKLKWLIIKLYKVIKNDCWGHTQYTPDATPCDSFHGVMSRIRFMFLLFPQVSRNWRYESEQPSKPSTLTCYRQFGTNSIIMLMFVESQRVHI